MNKLFKITLLLSLLIFLVNCQAKQVASDFKVEKVDEIIKTPIKPPSDDEDATPDKPNINDGLEPLSKQEFYIKNPSYFNFPLDHTLIQAYISVEFGITGDKLDLATFIDKSKTLVQTELILLEHKGGNVAYLKQGVDVENSGKTNGFNVKYKKELKNGLPISGTSAKYRINFYVKDLRGASSEGEVPKSTGADKENPKKYLVTTRTLDFTVTRK